METRTARGWHLLTAVVAAAALGLQLWLVVDGASVLVAEDPPGLGTRLVRLVSYFTILSNLLVLVSEAALVRRTPVTRWWRVLRLDAVVCIAVTAVVHWVALRPLLDLHGASYVADKLLHVVVPLLAVAGWVLVGPRGLVAVRDVLPAVVLPVVWLGWTLLHGAVSGWYPYPFLDVGVHGYPAVLAACLGVAVLLVVLCLVAVGVDGPLSRASSGTTPRRSSGRT